VPRFLVELCDVEGRLGGLPEKPPHVLHDESPRELPEINRCGSIQMERPTIFFFSRTSSRESTTSGRSLPNRLR
jgi:hypothetical protein